MQRKNVSYGYAQLMMGSEWHWDAFISWPIDTTCEQGRPSDFLSPTSFTSQCKSVSGKMWTMQQNAEFVLWHAELKSVVTVQRKWQRLQSGEKAPDNKTLNRWLKQFKGTGSVAKQKSSGWPGTLEENVDRIRQSRVRSPKKSIAHQNLELGIPKTMIQNIIHKRLCLHG
jgi:hypothetical protein